MIARKYIVISTLFVLIALTMVVPVIADPITYTVSVSSYGSGSTSLSQSKLSLLNEYSSQKPSISSLSEYSTLSQVKASALAGVQTTSMSTIDTLSPIKTSTLSGIFNGLNPSQGSVSAFAKVSQRTNSSALEFSQSVSVSGNIYIFDFSTSFT
jgi:hypothetical protein